MQPSRPSPTQENAATQTHDERQLLAQVLNKMGNPAWDLLLVGDGSGSGWNHACGWAATLIDNRHQSRRFFYGGMDCGSVNFAESMPYIQALTWYDTHYGKKMLQSLSFLQVHVLTDSQVIATWGNRAFNHEAALPRKQLALWSVMRSLSKVGYRCQFHWAPRQTTELNWAADLMAGLSRAEVMKAADPAYVRGDSHAARAANAINNLVFHDPETGLPLNPYNFNAG